MATSQQTATATVRIPTPLRSYTGGESAVPAEGATVGTALQDLVERHPDLRSHLYKEDGTRRSFVNIYLDDEDIRHLQGDDTPLDEGAELSIVPSVAGGC